MAKKRTTKKNARPLASGSRKSPKKGGGPGRNPKNTKKVSAAKGRPGSRNGAFSKGGKSRPKKAADDGMVRLQKYLAEAGVGSRRDCELLIVEGRVEVDGKPVTKLGEKVRPEKNVVTLDGEKVRTERKRYYIINKPPGVVSTSKDPSGRLRVVDLISSHQRVYNVGRLDRSSEGLMLVTNDGYLAQRLTHPSFGVTKTYHVQVKGSPHINELEVLKRGVHLAEGVARVKDVRVRRRQKNSSDLELVLDEGKNREIRRLLAKLGHKVVKLTRVAIGPLNMGDLKQGAHRKLTDEEVEALKKAVDIGSSGKKNRKNSKGPVKEKPIGFDEFQKEKEDRISQWGDKKRKLSGKKLLNNRAADEKDSADKKDSFPSKRPAGRRSTIPKAGSRKGIGRPSKQKRMAAAAGRSDAGRPGTSSRSTSSSSRPAKRPAKAARPSKRGAPGKRGASPGGTRTSGGTSSNRRNSSRGKRG